MSDGKLIVISLPQFKTLNFHFLLNLIEINFDFITQFKDLSLFSAHDEN